MAAAVAVIAALLAATAESGATPPPGAAGCPTFPADNYWHADVSALPVHARSADWLSSMGGPDRRLHPDFGPSGDSQPYGVPYQVVDASYPRATFTFEYADESDPGPYPFGPDTPIEGGSDRHALVIDRDTCRLHELFAVDRETLTAGSGAIFDLRSNALRPAGWTSADAAGLPIFPGLLRRDEVVAGHVDHAIRITASRTQRAYLWPARHVASSSTDPALPPMGAWFRMKASFDTSRFSAHTQTILRAFKKHGAIVADNGSNWYFTGAADHGWEDDVLDELKSIPASAFEAVDTSSLIVHPDSGQVRGAAPAAAPPSPPAAPVSSAAPTTSTSTTTAVLATTTSTTTTMPSTTTPTTTTTELGALAPASERERAQFRWEWWAVAGALVVAAFAAATSVRARRRRPRP